MIVNSIWYGYCYELQFSETFHADKRIQLQSSVGTFMFE